MTDENTWSESIKTDVTHERSWPISKDGSLGSSDTLNFIGMVVAKVRFTNHGYVLLKIDLEHCLYGRSHGRQGLDLGQACLPKRLSGGWNSDDPKAMESLFELAHEAAAHAARFYATMVKAWTGTFTEGLKDE